MIATLTLGIIILSLLVYTVYTKVQLLERIKQNDDIITKLIEINLVLTEINSTTIDKLDKLKEKLEDE